MVAARLGSTPARCHSQTGMARHPPADGTTPVGEAYTYEANDASVGDVFPALASGSALVLHPNPTELGPFELEAFCREHRISAVAEIADTRVLDGCQMDPNLVRSSCFQVQLEQRRSDERLERLVMGHAWPTSGNHRHLVIGSGMTPYRGLNGAGERIRVALDKSVIGLVHRPRPERPFQDRIGRLALRDDHQSGGSDVESLHDPLPFGYSRRRDSEPGSGKMAQDRGSAPT